MMPSRLRPAVVLSTWTLLVWTTRIRNIWTDESLDTGGQLWRTALALAFTVLAVATLVAWSAARRRPGSGSWSVPLVRVFAAWTVAVWAVRGVQIATADHDGAFVAVHTALAVASIALALWADRAVRRAPADREPPVAAGSR